MFFREICEIKPRERNLLKRNGVDPDKLIDPNEERIRKMVEESKRLSDEVWNSTFNPDKLICD